MLEFFWVRAKLLMDVAKKATSALQKSINVFKFDHEMRRL